MEKDSKIKVDDKFKDKSEMFIKKLESEMFYKSELTNNSMNLDWLEQIEQACPYLDNLIRNPKVFLVKVSEIVKIEKAKKVTVESVKDLSKHTHFIDKIDPKTMEVQPSKLLITKREETYNIYENRFLYTLLTNLFRFLDRQKKALEDLRIKDDKSLEYAGTTVIGDEKVKVELKMSSNFVSSMDNEKGLGEAIDAIYARLEKIEDYTISWRKSNFITSLEKERVSLVIPPIRKTNAILKNPNFQVAMKLWTFIQAYEDKSDKEAKNSLDTEGNDTLKGVLDDSFLLDYYVLDSISSSKKVQKEKLANYAIMMISHQVQRALSLLMESGIEVTDEDILKLISEEMKNNKTKKLIGREDVEKKFKSAIDEYLERTKDYL